MAEMTLDNTLGALQVGTIVAMFLFGIVTFQTSAYYTQFHDDRRLIKFMVGVVWMLEAAHTICVAYESYNSSITNFGHAENLTRFPVLGVATALGGAITFCVHTFFATRVWRVLPKPWGYIGVGCIVVSFVRFIGSVILGVAAASAPDVTTYRIKGRWLIVTLLSVGVALDFVIAVSMLWYLFSKRETAFSRSSRLIDRLVHYTIRTGALTSVGAITLLITFLVLPNTLIWIAVYACLAKIYSNSLLSALNDRTTLRDRAGQSSLEPSSGRREVPDTNRIVISVQTKSYADGGPYHEKAYALESMSPKTPDIPQFTLPTSQSRAESNNV